MRAYIEINQKPKAIICFLCFILYGINLVTPFSYTHRKKMRKRKILSQTQHRKIYNTLYEWDEKRKSCR